jgi:hypothetical protein
MNERGDKKLAASLAGDIDFLKLVRQRLKGNWSCLGGIVAGVDLRSALLDSFRRRYNLEDELDVDGENGKLPVTEYIFRAAETVMDGQFEDVDDLNNDPEMTEEKMLQVLDATIGLIERVVQDAKKSEKIAA